MATNAACSNGQIARRNATRAASKEKKAKATNAHIRQQYAIDFHRRTWSDLCSHSDSNPACPRKIPRDARITNDAADLPSETLVHDGPPRDERELVGVLDDVL
jgi:hypothetical protein